MKSQHSIQSLCAVLGVSSSGYYQWVKRRDHPGARHLEDRELAVEIRRIHVQSRQTYGSPRVQAVLRQRGRCHGRNRVARLMREHGLRGAMPRRWRVQTTDSRHDHPVAPNRLAEQPPPTARNRTWVGDITYIRTDEGWLYLAGIMDLYSRKIVGWSMEERMGAELTLAAWSMACRHRQPPQGLTAHSDRGVQYACEDYRQALVHAGALASMSRKGNCYDNAAMESFWNTLKNELVYRCHFRTRAEARQAIVDYIETFYNRHRLHSALGYKSPVDFENQNN